MPDAIARHLEEDLNASLRSRGIVLWLDRDNRYTEFVDRLAARHQAGDFFAPVVRFRGSYLEMMLALAPYGNGIDPEPLLIHLPGHNDTTVRQTPLLELYLAGKRYEKSLLTLIRDAASGKVAPDAIEAFLKTPDLTLAIAPSAMPPPTSTASTWDGSLMACWIGKARFTGN